MSLVLRFTNSWCCSQSFLICNSTNIYTKSRLNICNESRLIINCWRTIWTRTSAITIIRTAITCNVSGCTSPSHNSTTIRIISNRGIAFNSLDLVRSKNLFDNTNMVNSIWTSKFKEYKVTYFRYRVWSSLLFIEVCNCRSISILSTTTEKITCTSFSENVPYKYSTPRISRTRDFFSIISGIKNNLVWIGWIFCYTNILSSNIKNCFSCNFRH